MDIWWSSLPIFDKFLWGMAVFSSLTFLIQTILTFIGVGHHDTDFGSGHDIQSGHLETDGSSFFVGYFTIRNLIAFLLGFSWGGLVFVGKGMSRVTVIMLAMLIGLFFVFAVMMIMKGLSKLICSGTLCLEGAVGKEGTVAIMIPPKMGGQGKVNVTMQGRLIDLVAITKETEILKKGQQVKIVALSNEQLIVEKI
jgi:hypothetical protein